MEILSFVLFLTILKACQGQNYLCTAEYCSNYIQQTDCPDTPDPGSDVVSLLSPTPCNCCPYYLKKLKRGDVCQIGSPSSPPPDSVCGDGLSCIEDSSGTTCQPYDTVCSRAQLAWDEKRKAGTLGNMEVRPKCDREGNFAPVRCIPGQTCYCQNSDGERIFGDMPFKQNRALDMKCDCSRIVDTANKLIGKNQRFQLQTVRCLANGNYDPLQCFGNDCLCTDEFTGIPSDEDWFKKPINISQINSAMWCFDKKIHKVAQFKKPCQIQYELAKNETLEAEKNHFQVLGINPPYCQPDGMYDKVQETFRSKYCADPNGKQIGDYLIDKKSDLAKSMTCNCARAVLLLNDSEIHDIPECCPNGNYAKIQCRLNECRCVDVNGHQIEKEVYADQISKLSCYNEKEKLCTELE